MNKILVLVLVAAAAAVAYFKFNNDPPAPDPWDPKMEQQDTKPAPRTAPPAPVLAARAMSKGFETRGQWRGQPATGDLDGDGDLDLVTSLRRWDRKTVGEGVFIYLNDGKGGFTATVDGLRRDMGYGGAELADVNGDGKLDLAFSGHDVTPHLFLNFLDQERPTWVTTTPDGIDVDTICADVALGDFDGDGHVDLATVGQFPGKSGLYVLFGDGDGGLSRKTEVMPRQNFGSELLLNDLDGDGHVELVAATDIGLKIFGWDAEAGAAVERPGGFSKPAVGGSDLALDVADLDGDGVKEIVLSGLDYENHPPLRLFRRQADGTWKDWGSGLPAGESFFDAKFGRVDANGQVGLFLGGQWGIQVLTMKKPGEFESLGRIEGTTNLFNICAGDFTGDGKDEVVWVGEGGVRVYEFGR
jgi:hypothetical protein